MKEGLSTKLQLMIEPSLVEEIDDWRFANRIGSRAHAMRRLIKDSLASEKAKGPAATGIAPDLNTLNPA